MNWTCPYCNSSLQWRILSARHLSLRKTHYLCPACGGELVQTPFPLAYNLASLSLFPALALGARLVLRDEVVPWQAWAILAALALLGALGWRWSMNAVPKEFRRYEKAV